MPTFPWSASGRWRLRPPTVAVLVVGLWIFGTGDALLVDAGIGNSPWTVLAQGIAELTGLSLGLLTILIGAVVLLAWIPLEERPGFGTLANIVVIGVAIDVMLPLFPEPDAFGLQVLQAMAGVATVGLGGALYLSAHLGPGPRDGWMTGMAHRFDWPITWVRLGIEVTVLVVGIALGGTAGLGTVLFALTVGYALGLFLHLLPGGRIEVGAPPINTEIGADVLEGLPE